MIKKMLPLVALVMFCGCASTSVNFFGAKVTGKYVDRNSAMCNTMIGWGQEQITTKKENCVCKLDTIDAREAQRIYFQTGIVVDAVFIIVKDKICNPKLSNEDLVNGR
jgi:hypothetical protein